VTALMIKLINRHDKPVTPPSSHCLTQGCMTCATCTRPRRPARRRPGPRSRCSPRSRRSRRDLARLPATSSANTRQAWGDIFTVKPLEVVYRL